MRQLLLTLLGLGCLLAGCSKFGSKGDYYAETYFIYRPVRLPITLESRADLNANTVRRMISVPANLEKVREELQLEASLEDLEEAVSTTVIPSTSVLRIRVAWPTEDGAVAIAKTLREVFVQSQLDERRKLLQSMLVGLQRQLTDTEAELQQASRRAAAKQQELRKAAGLEFSPDVVSAKLADVENRMSITELELLADRRQLAEAEVLLGQIQTADTEHVTAVTTGSNQAEVAYLRQQVDWAKQRAEAVPHLQAATAAYDRAKEAYAKGLISQRQYEERQADLGHWQAVVSESPEVRRAQARYAAAVKDSAQATVGSAGSAGSPFNAAMQDAVRRRDQAIMALEGDRARLDGLTQKTMLLEEQRDEWKGPNPEMMRLNREVRVLRSQTDELMDSIPRVRKALESETVDFVLLTEAGDAKRARGGAVPENE